MARGRRRGRSDDLPSADRACGCRRRSRRLLGAACCARTGGRSWSPSCCCCSQNAADDGRPAAWSASASTRASRPLRRRRRRRRCIGDRGLRWSRPRSSSTWLRAAFLLLTGRIGQAVLLDLRQRVFDHFQRLSLGVPRALHLRPGDLPADQRRGRARRAARRRASTTWCVAVLSVVVDRRASCCSSTCRWRWSRCSFVPAAAAGCPAGSGAARASPTGAPARRSRW